QRLALRPARQCAADQDAHQHRHQPAAQQLPVDRALGVVGAQRGDRGRNDGRQRRADRDVHAHIGIDPHKIQHVIEHRHDHDAAADAEHAGEEPADDAGDHQPQGKHADLAARSGREEFHAIPFAAVNLQFAAGARNLLPLCCDGGTMDRRSVLGLAAMAALSAKALAAVPGSDRLPGDPLETVPLWRRTPPGGEGVHLTLNLMERSPQPDVFHDRFVTDIQTPLLTVFRPDKPDGSALLVAPGGGYRRVVIDNEGFDIGHRFNGSGVTVFVLRYRLPAEGWANGPDVPLQDAQRAMRLIRGRAADFAIDPGRVGVLGFSAGGHLAASLLTRSDEPAYKPVDDFDALSARPDFAGLAYPVISMIPPVAHPGSREKLLG